jgi:hypothetical protein
MKLWVHATWYILRVCVYAAQMHRYQLLDRISSENHIHIILTFDFNMADLLGFLLSDGFYFFRIEEGGVAL